MCGPAKDHSPVFSIGGEHPGCACHICAVFSPIFFNSILFTFKLSIMLCYLQSAELRPREGKTPFFICRWNGVQGDANAEKVTEKDGIVRINVKAALARTITLTKSIFPVDHEALKEWAKLLKCRKMTMPKKDEDGNYLKDDNGDYVMNEKIVEENANKTVVNLIYKQVPLSRISDEVKRIEFITNDGRTMRQDFITVIGFADENDNWAEEQTPEDMALNNLNTNLGNGTYTDVTDEEEDKPTRAVSSEKPSKEDSKKSEKVDDWDL